MVARAEAPQSHERGSRPAVASSRLHMRAAPALQQRRDIFCQTCCCFCSFAEYWVVFTTTSSPIDLGRFSAEKVRTNRSKESGLHKAVTRLLRLWTTVGSLMDLTGNNEAEASKWCLSTSLPKPSRAQYSVQMG